VKPALLAALLLIASLPLFGAKSERYKNWPDSPQGYFMTHAERTAWAALPDDEHAAAFIEDFVKRRGGQTFIDQVSTRTEKADQYLTVGKTAGSKSLRGKLVILFGPPAGMDVSEHVERETKRDSPQAAAELSNVDSSASGRNSDAGSINTSRWMATEKRVRTFHFTFGGDAAKPLKRDHFEVTIDADATTGADQAATRQDAKLLDEAFEAAAQASIK
jgi:GWxTD domain-containing protein